jgi:MFS family permease
MRTLLATNKAALPLTALMCATAFWIFSEQNLMAPSLSSVAEEFGFNDEEKDMKLGGELSIGFFLVGGICGLLVGYLTDAEAARISRTMLFAIVVLCGKVGCIGTYLCSSFTELLVYRAITGVAVGGAAPIIYSILGDLWGTSSRVLVSTCVGMSMSFGAAFGQVLAAFLAPSYGWRFPFIVVAIPSLICVAMLMLVKDPTPPPVKAPLESDIAASLTESGQGSMAMLTPEKAREETTGNNPASHFIDHFPAVSPNTPVLADASPVKHRHVNFAVSPVSAAETVTPMEQTAFSRVRDILQLPTARLVYLQGIFGCVPWAILGVYFNDFLQHDLNLTVHTSTLLMTTFGIGAALGQVGGGALGQRLYNADPRRQTLLMGITTILGAIPLILIINNEDFVGSSAKAMKDTDSDLASVKGGITTPALGIYMLFFMAGMLAAVTGPNVRSLLQNVTTARNRGLAFALFTLCDDVGKGAGPYAVARLISYTGSRKEAFDVGILSWVVSGSFCLLMFFWVLQDTRSRKEGKVTTRDGKLHE